MNSKVILNACGRAQSSPASPFPILLSKWCGTPDCENIRLFGRAEDCLQFSCVELHELWQATAIQAWFNACMGMHGRRVLWEHSKLYIVQNFSFCPFLCGKFLFSKYERGKIKLKKNRWCNVVGMLQGKGEGCGESRSSIASGEQAEGGNYFLCRKGIS